MSREPRFDVKSILFFVGGVLKYYDSRQVSKDKIVKFLECFWYCTAKPYKGTFTTTYMLPCCVRLWWGRKGENFCRLCLWGKNHPHGFFAVCPFCLFFVSDGRIPLRLTAGNPLSLPPSPTRGRSAIFKLPFSPSSIGKRRGALLPTSEEGAFLPPPPVFRGG